MYVLVGEKTSNQIIRIIISGIDRVNEEEKQGNVSYVTREGMVNVIW